MARSLRRSITRIARSSADLATAALVLASVALRVRSAWGTFVAPDEAIVLEISSRGGPAEIWSASISNPHPPLVYLLLSAWLEAGRGDLWVRLFPILLTALGLLLLARTTAALLGRSRALVALALVAASPTLVPSTTEVRPYPLLFVLAAASIEALRLSTRPAPGGRTLAALAFAALASLSVASHYSAILLLAGLFPWAAARAARNLTAPAERALALAVWAVPAAAGALFWIGHISHQISFGLAGQLLSGIYSRGVGAPGADVLEFLAWQSWRLAGWLGGPLAPVLAIALGAGLLRLARRRSAEALLVLGPVAAGIAAALLGKYPYGPFRQSTYLLVPLAIGAAAGVPAMLLRRRARTGAALALLAWGLVFLAPARAPSGLEKGAQRRVDLDAALAEIDALGGARPTVLVDLSSSVVLAWYRGEPGVDYWKSGPGDPRLVSMGSLRLRIGWLWAHDGESLARDLAAAGDIAGGGGRILAFAIWPTPALVRYLDSGEPASGPGAPGGLGAGALTAALR